MGRGIKRTFHATEHVTLPFHLFVYLHIRFPLLDMPFFPPYSFSSSSIYPFYFLSFFSFLPVTHSHSFSFPSPFSSSFFWFRLLLRSFPPPFFSLLPSHSLFYSVLLPLLLLLLLHFPISKNRHTYTSGRESNHTRQANKFQRDGRRGDPTPRSKKSLS